MRSRARIIVGFAVITALVGASVATGAGTKVSRAARYCTQHGGVVQTRTPSYGANGADGLALAGPIQFCKFTSKADGSRIYAALSTLFSKKPTLAALAYLEKPPVPKSTGGVNPASVYCSNLGGSDLFGGVSAGGGGWVSRSDKADLVLEACVFPDRSIIDSWGLTYHANGIVRGANLQPILRYHPARPPHVFG